MHRRLMALTLCLAATPAWAEDEPGSDYSGDKEIGARVGLQLGASGVTPGGFALGGSFLYRLTESLWFDGAMSFTFGGGEDACFTDRDGALICDHGMVDGIGMQALAGVRYTFGTHPGGFHPYARGGAGIALAEFDQDDVHGLTFPLFIGGGGRFPVSERISVGGEALLFGGPGSYGADLGTEAYGGMIVQALVDFTL